MPATRKSELENGGWRPEPESNRRARICSPLRNHSAIGPRAGPFPEHRFWVKPVNSTRSAGIGHGRSSFDQRRLALAKAGDMRDLELQVYYRHITVMPGQA